MRTIQLLTSIKNMMLNTVRLFLAFAVCAVVVAAQAVQISPLDGNTSSDDFAPALTNHGRTVVVTTDESGKQQLKWMERTSGGWTSLSSVGAEVNDGKQVGTAALTSDGQFMIFAAYRHDVDGMGRTDLYSARRNNGKWEKVTNIGGQVNSSYYDSQPTLSADGRTLYFVSDRPGGFGGSDIYTSQWTGTEWTTARPLPNANSASEDMSPVIAADGKTFYFSSNRGGGQGGFDVYTGKIDASGLGSVRNVGDPINTVADEMFYTSLPNSNQAFFSRTTRNGDWDNYLAVPNPFPGEPVTLVEGIVRDITTKVPLGSDITVTDLSTGKNVSRLRSDDATGQYYVTLTPGRVYSITAKRAGYLFHSERYEVPPNAQGQTIKKDIDLVPHAGGGNRLLVYFDYDKAELKSESMPELESVIEMLRENPSLRVRFDGHTDDQGSDEYNDKLSERRALAVKDYVTAGGVDKSRVESGGFGKRKPVMKGATDEARALNRRVEMRVVK